MFTGNGDLMAQGLLSHFESSIHAALNLPKYQCFGRVSSHCRQGSGKGTSFL